MDKDLRFNFSGGALQKHKGWFNNPWLPQLQFKATILYSRSIWVEAMPNVSNCFSGVNIQEGYFNIVYEHSVNTHALNASKDTSLEERPAFQLSVSILRPLPNYW